MKKKLSNLYLEQLINGHLDYVNFQAVHKGDENEDAPKCIPNMSDSDELVTEALDFFENRSYTDPVVDLLVQVTCDALHVNLYIYQKMGEKIQILCNFGG